MKTLKPTFIFVALLVLLTAGCYTQFYRPGMERVAQGPYDQLYNRNDSTAIDTTLERDTTAYESSSDYTSPYNDSWYYWGRPRTRWGFDFNDFDPSYYWSYYGYYDYYGVPWWNGSYDPWYGGWQYPGWGGGSGAPPTKRPGRREHDTGGGTYAAPQPAPSSPTYANPTSGNPPASSGGSSGQQSGGEQKRDGKRGR